MTDLPSVPRYRDTGSWYKGNTHIHSTVSDGGLTFAELGEAYVGKGYDFLFRTDHWVTSDATADAAGAPLLWLDGVELDGRDAEDGYYHVVCLGQFKGISREMGFLAAIEAVRDQGGLLILAHPTWTGNTFEQATRWGFHGVEIYNHVCHWLNGKGDGLAYWQAMLRADPGVLGFASDDAHIHAGSPGWNGAWVRVQAETLTPEAIMDALRVGRFYGSQGPAFERIQYDGAHVEIETSPVQFARLVGPAYLGQRMGDFAGSLVTRIAFDIPADWPYAYLEIEDARGRRAWTNTLMTTRS